MIIFIKEGTYKDLMVQTALIDFGSSACIHLLSNINRYMYAKEDIIKHAGTFMLKDLTKQEDESSKIKAVNDYIFMFQEKSTKHLKEI